MKLAEARILSDLAALGSAAFGDRPALLRGGDRPESALTYAQLEMAVDRAACDLASRGLRRGARVLLIAESGPSWLVTLLALGRAGLVAVPAPADAAVERLRHMAEHIGAGAVVVPQALIARRELPPRLALVTIEELLETGPRDRGSCSPSRADDLALLVFTSGSTSRPKAVALTHGNLLWNVRALLQRERATCDDAFLSMLPLSHLFELVAGQLCPLACGARLVYSGPLLPNRLLAALRTHRITRALVVPALLRALYEETVEALVDAGAVDPGARDLSLASTAEFLSREARPEQLEALRRALRARIGEDLFMLVVGGAAIDPAWATLCAALGIVLEVGYGLTEAGPIVAQGRAQRCPAGSVGRPLPGVEVRVDGRGEIFVRSPAVMAGYDGDPSATAAALVDGWLRTGDRGWLDSDGFLFVTGRMKEAIVTEAGTTISPEEIEPAYGDPLFAEFCVVPMAGPCGNDRPVLVVVPVAASTTDEEINEAFARLRAAAPSRCRVERVVRTAGPLPRTATGKIQRRSLAQSLFARSDDDARR